MARQNPAPQSSETWADYIDRLTGFRPPTARLVRAQMEAESRRGGKTSPMNDDTGEVPSHPGTDKT
jgi:hypothetical protein